MDGRPDAARKAANPAPAAQEAVDATAGADEAVFRVAQVGGRSSRRSTLAALALTASVAGLVLAGALDGSTPGAGGSGSAPGAVPGAAPMRDVPATRVLPLPAAAAPAPSVLVLHTRAWGRYVLVHADVHTIDAVVVIVSIVDSSDRVVGIQAIDMPKGSRALRLGASDRFQIAFEVDGLATAEVAYVQANAYDRIGRLFVSERQLLVPATSPGWWRSEVGG